MKGEFYLYVSSSIGRAAVSKTAGWGFESLLTCDTTEHGEDSLLLIGGREKIPDEGQKPLDIMSLEETLIQSIR